MFIERQFGPDGQNFNKKCNIPSDGKTKKKQKNMKID